MAFQKVMLAHPMKPGFILNPGEYSAEEKVDGIRIECEIETGSSNLFTKRKITPWSRLQKIHPLPTHIMEDLSEFPESVLDGEIYVEGKRSYGAVELTNLPDLVFCVFDVISIANQPTTHLKQFERRMILEELFKSVKTSSVVLNPSTNVNTMDEVYALRDAVWARDGEGLILKRRNAVYQHKRSKDWIKIKKLQSAVLTVIGFQPSRGLINDRGPYATIILRDDSNGVVTTVKTRNDEECRKLEKEAIPDKIHPAIGRKLRIEFQEKTPDMNFRHPRFDHWEDE